MNKQELVKSIAIGAGVSHAQAAKMLTAMRETMQNVLSLGERISVRGLGTFTVSEHSARLYHHPQSGEKRMARAYRTVRFIPSGEIKSNLN